MTNVFIATNRTTRRTPLDRWEHSKVPALTGRVGYNVVKERPTNTGPLTLHDILPTPDHLTDEWPMPALCEGVLSARMVSHGLDARPVDKRSGPLEQSSGSLSSGRLVRTRRLSQDGSAVDVDDLTVDPFAVL
jgi:hypothetical protein